MTSFRAQLISLWSKLCFLTLLLLVWRLVAAGCGGGGGLICHNPPSPPARVTSLHAAFLPVDSHLPPNFLWDPDLQAASPPTRGESARQLNKASEQQQPGCLSCGGGGWLRVHWAADRSFLPLWVCNYVIKLAQCEQQVAALAKKRSPRNPNWSKRVFLCHFHPRLCWNLATVWCNWSRAAVELRRRTDHKCRLLFRNLWPIESTVLGVVYSPAGAPFGHRLTYVHLSEEIWERLHHHLPVCFSGAPRLQSSQALHVTVTLLDMCGRRSTLGRKC